MNKSTTSSPKPTLPFPVDIVYTWVDGDDPTRRQELGKYKELSEKKIHRMSTASYRWNNHDELKYSIRSIEKFAPWVNTIYIITSFNQCPNWLNKKHFKVKLIPDSLLLDSETQLPTFNSHAIEANLHKIPGLSEHFIYFCDDYFIGAPTSPYDFFTSHGNARLFLSKQVMPRGKWNAQTPAWEAARWNNSTILDNLFGKDKSRRDMVHQAIPLKKSMYGWMWNHIQLKPLLVQTSESRFRHQTDIHATGLAAFVAYNYGLAIPVRHTQLRTMCISMQSPLSRQAGLFRKLKNLKPKLYCLNDVSSGWSSDDVRLLRRFLETYYPKPSSVELVPLSLPSLQKNSK